MSDRKLRSNTRKDYNKMEKGVNGAVESDSENNNGEDDHACVHDENQNKHDHDDQQQHESGESSNSAEESGSEIEYASEFESEEEDDELAEAERKLQLLKKQKKLLLQQAKRARIAKETEEVEKSLKELKKNSKSKKKKLTSASLRSMDDVVSEVDRLMDENLCIRKRADSQSEAESDVVSVSVKSSASSGSRRRKPSEERPEKKAAEKKISGKSKNSLNSQIRFPQKWPHSYLNPSFVNSREKTYEDLTISEFVAGYMTILDDEESEDKRLYRREHLKELMYLSTRFKWRNILDYHGACLTEIERGHLKWGSSFQLLQSTTLSGGLLTQNRGGPEGASSGASRPARGEGVIFCKGYQRGTCQQPKDHYGLFYGVNRLLKHICAKCWQHSKAQLTHPEASDECPSKDLQ